MPDIEVYHVRLRIWNCAVRVVINGVEVASSGGRSPTFLAPPLNPFLVGQRNVLRLFLSPPQRPPYPDALDASAQVTGDVAAFREQEVVTAVHGGRSIAALDCSARSQNLVGQGEVIYESSFSSSCDVFKSLARSAPRIDDGDLTPLLDYATHIHMLAATRQIAAILSECAIRVADYAAAYGVDVPSMEAEFGAELRDLLEGRLEPVSSADVRIIPHCGGRICELARWKKRPLLTAALEHEGHPVEGAMRVLVAKVGGRLRIVR